MSQDAQRQIKAAIEEVKNIGEPGEAVEEIDIGPDRSREVRTPGFARMRSDWRAADAAVMTKIFDAAEATVFRDFLPAFSLIGQVYDIVRTPEVDTSTGEVLTDAYGMRIWKRTPTGMFIEDWSRLGRREREELLYRTSLILFELEQTAARYWGEAMYAKGLWEERFAEGFLAVEGRPTVDHRTQLGRKHSQDERYFAIFRSVLSKKADGIVKTITLINQRLKDGLE